MKEGDKIIKKDRSSSVYEITSIELSDDTYVWAKYYHLPNIQASRSHPLRINSKEIKEWMVID